MKADAELLRDYAQDGSEGAFTELVERHLPLVYAAALRKTGGDAELARDICQTVFFDLARKARSLAGHELLIGWLFTATRFHAATALRGIRRRQHRERMAAAMQKDNTPLEHTDKNAPLLPALDAAMEELPAEDRNAVLLRFFQGKAFKEVGAALGISEDAARMRIGRALAKLQSLLQQSGATVSIAALGTLLAAFAATAAPAGLALSISTTATASAALAATSVNGVAFTTAQKGFAVAAALAIAGLAVTQTATALRLRRENDALRTRLQTAPEVFMPPQVSGTAVESGAGAEKPSDELLKARGEANRWRREATDALADAGRIRSKYLQMISNAPPPIKTFTAQVMETATWNEGLVTGGWKMQSGKRTYVFTTFDPVSEAGNLIAGSETAQIVVQAKIVLCSDSASEALGLAGFNADGELSMASHKISRNEMAAILKNAAASASAQLLFAPTAVTISGRQVQMSSADVKQTPGGEQYSVGPTIDLMPTISPGGKSLQISMVTKLNCSLKASDPELPDMRDSSDDSTGASPSAASERSK